MENLNSVPNAASTRMHQNFSTRDSNGGLAEYAVPARGAYGDRLSLRHRPFRNRNRSRIFFAHYVTLEWCCEADGTVSSMAAQDFQHVEEQGNTGEGAQLHITAAKTVRTKKALTQIAALTFWYSRS